MKKRRTKTQSYQEDYLLNTSEYQKEVRMLRIHSFCHSFLTPQWNGDRYKYPFVLVSMILSGTNRYITADGDSVSQHQGYFYISDLNERKDESISLRTEMLERYFILLEVNPHLRVVLRELFPAGLPKFLSSEPERLKRCFEDIRRILRKKEEPDDILLGAMGYRLLCEAARQISPASDLPEKLLLALRYIDNRFCSPTLNRRKIAAAGGMSMVQLGKLFQENLHSTVNRYVTNLRLEKAKHLLTHTGLPVKEIAGQCGFSYAYYFARVFRENTGVLPGKFRREQLKRSEE